jgi:hypothetical protein
MLAEEEAAAKATAQAVVESREQVAKEEEERAGREVEQHAVFDAEMMEAVRGMDSVVPYTLRSPYTVLLLYKVRDKDSRDQHLLAIYHGMDLNDDGTVTRKEVSAALQQQQVVVQLTINHLSLLLSSPSSPHQVVEQLFGLFGFKPTASREDRLHWVQV